MEPQAIPGWIERLVERRRPAALATLLLGALLAAGLPRVRFDASNQGLFLEGDPTLATLREFERRFGADEVLYVLVELPAGQDAFAPPALERLLALGGSLRGLPHACGLRSPLHSPVTWLEAGALVSRSLERAAPSDEAARSAWRARVLGWAPFRGLLISPDGRRVGFTVELEPDLSPEARQALLEGVERLRGEAPLRDWPHAATGTAINPVLIGRILQRELARSVVSACLVAIAALWLLFRSPRAVAATLIQLALVLAGTLGLMGWLAVPLSSISAILITLLACVGLADCMHVTASYERLARDGAPPARAAAEALAETWWPCLVTSLTNVGGFLALGGAPLRPIAHLGVFAAVGTALAYLVFLGLAPAALTGWSPAGRGPAEPGRDPWAGALQRLAGLTARRPGRVLALGLLGLALLAAGIPRLGADTNVLRDMDPDEPLRRDLEFVHARMGGTISIEVVVEPRDPEDPALLAEVIRRCERLGEWLPGLDPSVRTVRGIADGVQEVHALFDGPRRVPQDPAAVAQLLLLLQSADSDWYEDHLTIGGQATRVTVRLDLVSSRTYERIKTAVEAELARQFQDPAAPLGRAYLTGGALLLAHADEYVVQTQVQSFAWSLGIVAAIVLLSVRSLKLGLVSLLPNVGPVVAMLGLMGWLSVPLEVGSALLATVALGIVVDDTVHVVHAFAEQTRAGVPVELAIERVLQRAGRAVLFTSLVLVAGFATYLGSSLRPIRTFGWLAAVTFGVAFLADAVLLPALLRLCSGRAQPMTFTAEGDESAAPSALERRSPRYPGGSNPGGGSSGGDGSEVVAG